MNAFSVPVGWYRPARDFFAEFEKTRGRAPNAAEEAIIKEQVRQIRGGQARLEELTAEHHHAVMDFFLKHGRLPTGYPSNDAGENRELVQAAMRTVEAHTDAYAAAHPSILGSIADFVTSPAKAAAEKGLHAAYGGDFRVTSVSVSPKELLQAAQAVISFVPVVGAGINAAIAAGAALANGENITDALVEGAENALPGGPLAKQAFKSGVAAVKAIAHGDNIGDAALAAAREALPNDEAKKAFDVGIAIAHGQNVQEALVKGATSFAGKAVESLSHAALPLVLTKAAQLLPPEVTRVATALQNTPGLRALPAAEIAKTLGVNPSIATQAQNTVNAVWEKIGKLTPEQQKELVAWGERSAAHHPNVRPALKRALLAVKETKPLTKAELDAKAAWAKIAKIAQDAKSSDPRVRAQAEKDAKILSVIAKARKKIVSHMAKHGGGTPGVLIDGKGRQIRGRFVENVGSPESILYTRKGAREGRFAKIA